MVRSLNSGQLFYFRAYKRFGCGAALSASEAARFHSENAESGMVGYSDPQTRRLCQF